MNDSRYPWVILIPKVPGVAEIHELANEQQYLLLITSVLLSLYFKRAHLVLLRSFSLVRGYHMWMVIAAKSELEVQKVCRQIDEKTTFEVELIGPAEPEEKPKKRRRRKK